MKTEDRIKKYLSIKDNCEELGIAIPSKVKVFLDKLKDKPKQSEIRPLIKKVKVLLRGFISRVQLPEWGLTAKVNFYLADEDIAIEVLDVEFDKNVPRKLAKYLKQTKEGLLEELEYYNIPLNAVGESVLQEIKDVLKISENLKKQYKNYDWQNDILFPGGG